MKALFSCAALAGIALAVAPASAAPRDREGPSIGITRAVAEAERATGGKVMEAELDRTRTGRLIYEIEIAKDGMRHEIDIDARTGRVVARRSPVIAGYWTQWFGDSEVDSLANARPLSELLADLERRSGGRVRDVSLDIEGGRALYEIEIATGAGVADIHIDPRTGARLALADD